MHQYAGSTRWIRGNLATAGAPGWVRHILACSFGLQREANGRTCGSGFGSVVRRDS